MKKYFPSLYSIIYHSILITHPSWVANLLKPTSLSVSGSISSTRTSPNRTIRKSGQKWINWTLSMKFISPCPALFKKCSKSTLINWLSMRACWLHSSSNFKKPISIPTFTSWKIRPIPLKHKWTPGFLSSISHHTMRLSTNWRTKLTRKGYPTWTRHFRKIRSASYWKYSGKHRRIQHKGWFSNKRSKASKFLIKHPKLLLNWKNRYKRRLPIS